MKPIFTCALLLVLSILIATPSAPAQGINDLLGRSKENPESPAPPDRQPQPAPRVDPGMDIDRQIAGLKASAPHQPETFKTFAAARERAAEYRRRVDRMRRLLYIPDPRAESELTLELNALQQRWGELALSISRGQIPQAPVAPERWTRYAQGFSKIYCDRVPQIAPARGMPLTGWAWTCLSDRFFKELAEIEVRAEAMLENKRDGITGTLEGAMKAAEYKISLAGDMENPPSFLLREVEQLLHQVDKMHRDLRIKELEIQRAAAPGTPSFRWLLELSHAVLRPANGSGLAVRSFRGARLTVKVEDVVLEKKIVQPRIEDSPQFGSPCVSAAPRPLRNRVA
jgi:hypothetical protein